MYYAQIVWILLATVAMALVGCDDDESKPGTDAQSDAVSDVIRDAPKSDSTVDTAEDGNAEVQGDAPTDVNVGPFKATLRLTNNSGASIWVQSAAGTWLAIQRDGTDLILGSSCLCTCYYYPECPMCDAPIPAVVEVVDGQTLEYVWQGTTWEVEAERQCYNETMAPEREFEAVFDWGTGFQESEWAPGVNAQYLTGEATETIAFLLGTDAVIEAAVE